MGLLLSVLVACVGVVELITFYHNVTRTVPSYRSAPTNLNRGYVRELKDVRKTIYSDLRKIESGKDVDINNVSYRTELHNKLLSYSENYEDLQGEPVSKLTINQEPNESSSSTRFTNIPEEETGTTFPSHLKYEVHKVHSSFTSTNFSNDHKDFVHLPLPDEICDTKNEAPSSSSWHDQNEDPTRRSPSPFPQLPVPRNSLCNELDDDVVIYDQPSLAYIQHDSKDYWTTSKTLDPSCNISLHKGQYNRDVTTDLQDSNQQNNHVSTNLPFVDRNQHTPPNSKEQCTHLVFSDLLYANKELFAPVKQNICYVTTDVIYDNNQKNNHIPHLDKEHSNEPKDNRLTTNLPFVNKDNHIACDISGNFNEQQSDHISNLPFVDRVDFYINPVIADVSCDNHLPTNLPYPYEETVSVNFNDQNNHNVIVDKPKLFTNSENDFPEDFNDPNNDLNTDLPLINQETNFIESKNQLVETDLHFSIKENIPTVFNEQTSYVTADLLLVSKENALGVFVEEQKSHALLTDVPHIDKNIFVDSVERNNQQVTTDLPLTLNRSNVPMTILESGSRDVDTSYVSAVNGILGDSNEQKINSVTTDLPLVNIENSEHKNHISFVSSENNSVDYIKENSHPVVIGLPLVTNNSEILADYDEQKFQIVIPKDIFTDSIKQNSHPTNLPLTNNNENNVQLEPIEQMINGTADVSSIGTKNNFSVDMIEQNSHPIAVDLPLTKNECNVPIETIEHENDVIADATSINTLNVSVASIKQNIQIITDLPLAKIDETNVLAETVTNGIAYMPSDNIENISVVNKEQSSHPITANLPLATNSDNDPVETVGQMTNGIADVPSGSIENNISVVIKEQSIHPITTDLPLAKNENNVPIETVEQGTNIIADVSSINTENVSVDSTKQSSHPITANLPLATNSDNDPVETVGQMTNGIADIPSGSIENNISVVIKEQSIHPITTDLPLAKNENNVPIETVEQGTNIIADVSSINTENVSVDSTKQSSHPITANLPLATNSDNDPVETVGQMTNGIADIPSGSIENNISVVIKEQSIHPITTDLPLAKNENNVPIETVEQGTNIIADVSSINTENVSVDSTKQSSHPITANLPLATNSDNDPVETVGQMTNGIADIPSGSIENNISVVIKEQSSHPIATDLPLAKYENHVPIETVEQETNIIANVPSINTENVSADSIKTVDHPITVNLPLDDNNDNVLIETVGQTTNRIANVSYDSTEKNISVGINEQNSHLTDLPLTKNESNVQVETVEQGSSVTADVPSINKETTLVDSIKQSSHPITANLPLTTNSDNDPVETVIEMINIGDVPFDSTDNFTSVHEQNFHPITVDLPSAKIRNKVSEENVIVDVPYVNTENSIAVDIEIHKNTSINTDLPLVNNENVSLESVEQKSHHDVTSATTVDLVDSSIQENQHTFMNLPLVNKKIILADSGEQVIELIDDVPYISTQDSIYGNTDKQNNHRLGVDAPLANNENNIPVVSCEEKIQVITDDSYVSTGNNNDVDHQNSHHVAADLPLANKNVSLETGEQQCYVIADMPLVSTENITADLEQKGHLITADLPLVNENNFIKENNHRVVVDVYCISAENKIPVNINEQNSYPITTDLPSINNANPIEIVDEKNYVIADAPGVSTENIPTDLEEKSHPITADLPSPNDKTVSLRTGEQQSNVIADIPVVSTEKISADLKENNHPITADLPLVNNENNFMEETNHQVIATLSCVSAENNSSVNNSEENSRSITTDLPLVNNENISVEIVGEKSNYVIVDVPDVSKKSIFEDHEQTNLPITADLLLVNDENAPLENAEQKCHVIADIPLANTENILEDLKQKSHLITTDLPLVNNENRTTVEIVEEKSNQVTTNVPSVSAESNVVDPNEQSIHLITTDLPNNEHDISAVSVEEKKDNVISDISCVSTVHIINEQYFCPITTDLPLSSDKNNVPVETSEEKNHVVDVPSVSTENNIPVDSNKQNHFITHDLPLVKENKKNSIADESSVGLENTMPLNANEQYHSSISTDLPLANNVPVVCNEEKIHPIIASVPCLSTETNINPDPSEQNSCPIITDLPLVNVPVADFGEQEIHHVSIETKTPVDFNGQISHVTADLPLVSEENVQVHFGEQNAHVIADVTGVSVENILVDSNEQISQLVNIGLPLIYKENVSMVVSDETQESHDVVADVVCVETKNDIAVEFSKISNDTSELLLVKGDVVPVCRVEEEKRVSVDLHLVNNVPIDSNLQESEHVIADLPLVNNNNYLPMDSKEQISDQVSTDVCINAEKDIFMDSEEKCGNVSSDLPLINNVPVNFNKKDSDPTDIPLVSSVNNDIIDDLPLVNNENNALVDCNEQISNQNIVCSRTESGFIVDSSEKSSDVVRDLPLINNGSLEFNASDLTVINELPLVSIVTAEQKNNDILNDLPLVNFECNASNEPISNRVSTDVALSEVASVEANEKNTDLPFVKENVQVVFDERNNYEVIQSNLDVSEGKISLTDSELEFEDALEDNGSFDEHLLDNLDGIKHKIRSDKKSYKKKNIGSSCLETATASMPLAFSNDHTTDEPKVASDGSGKSNSSTSHNDDTGSKEPEPFWLIFSGEYTKAMNKDWHGQHFCCWQCDESLTGQRYVLRDDHPYCVSCYESVFANACEKCSRTIGIDSKDLSYKDKHWHEACFLCTTCGESLVDKQFGSKGDRIYCGSCYDQQFASRCDGCHEIFRAGTKKMEYKTRQWHEKCFCCCVCKTPIGTQSFIPREQEIYCAKCYEDKFATRCIKCNKVITSGGVTYKNEPWHRECFTCTHCQKSLAGERFTSRDEKPYCADCFGELFAKRCTACNKPITGIGGTKFISFEDRHWHNDCFYCAMCRTSLVGRGFITDNEDIICPECAKQKLM